MVNSGLCLTLIPSLRKLRPSSYTRSNPPTMSRFKYSSGAMRMNISMSSVLWWVTNGRAAAPPATVLSMGVSTSINPSLSKYARMAVMIFDRATNVSLTSGLAMRSTYRCR